MTNMIPLIKQSDMKDKFGKWRTYSLFKEHKIKGYPFYWSLKEKGTDELPSLREIYLSYNHIPGFEYEFAQEVIGSWIHWQRLCRSGIKQHIAEWREELDIKLKAKAMRVIIDNSVTGEGASRLQAAKYLADKGYSPIRGRPSKEEKAGLLKRDSIVNSEIEDDLERVGLTLAR